MSKKRQAEETAMSEERQVEETAGGKLFVKSKGCMEAECCMEAE